MSDATTRGWLIGTIISIYAGLILVSFVKYETETYRHIIQTNHDTNPENDSAVQSSVVDLEANSSSQYYPCEDPESGPNSDLCQQWRMAETAEKLTDLTLGQIIITTLEICLLMAALIYSVVGNLGYVFSRVWR